MVRSFRRICQDNDIRVIKSTTLEIYTDSDDQARVMRPACFMTCSTRTTRTRTDRCYSRWLQTGSQ